MKTKAITGRKCCDPAQKKNRGRTSVVDRIVRSYSLLSQGVNPSFLAKMNLTTAQMKVLALFADKKKYSMGELSARYSVSVSTMTSMVDRLCLNGILKREQDSRDRRIVLVSLTAKGRRATNRLVHARRDILENFLKTLNPDEVKRFDRAMHDAAYFLSRARETIRLRN